MAAGVPIRKFSKWRYTLQLGPLAFAGNLRQSDAHEGEGEAQPVDCDPNIFRMWILTESGQQCSQVLFSRRASRLLCYYSIYKGEQAALGLR